MTECATCGNSYDATFKVVKDGEEFEFDSFECAIERLAPRCERCNCRVIGHGVQDGANVYCCAHCAKQAGAQGLADRH